MGLSQTLDYSSAAGFTYDASLIEFVGGVARLREQVPSDGLCYANYSTSVNLNRGGGTLTGTLVGTAALGADGTLDCRGGAIASCDYSATGNAALALIGTVRIRAIAGYSGTPASNRHIFSISNGSSNVNGVNLYHGSNGQLHLSVWGSTGTSLINVDLGAFTPVAGQEYEFELNMNVTSGSAGTRVFVDGVQLGTTLVQAGTRTNTATLLRIGSSPLGGNNTDFAFQTVQVWDTTQHTSAYTPSYTPFPESAAIVNSSGVLTDALDLFSASGVEGDDEIKFQIQVGGENKWFDGTSWETSDGTADEANTASEIDDNLATLDLTAGVTIKVRVLLVSSDRTSTPTLTAVTLFYDFHPPDVTAPGECNVYTRLTDILGDAVTDAVLIVKNKTPFFATGTLIQPFTQRVTFDADGYADVSLVETETAETTYEFRLEYVTDSGTTKTVKLGDGTVPNETSANLGDIF